MHATRGDKTLYFTETTAHSAAYFGEENGIIHFDFVQCSNSAQNLTQCNTHNSGSSNHSLDVGVKCQPGIFYIYAFILSQKNVYSFSAEGSYREGDIRLVGGPHNWKGRVEIFCNRTWGAIDDFQWTANDANVVCRQQHYPGNSTVIHTVIV